MIYFLFCLLLFVPVADARGGEAVAFVYHRFGDNRFPSTNVGTDVFAAQLEILKEKNYIVLPLGEVVRRLSGGQSLPDRCAVITVDDAFESFLTDAMPLLRRYGYPSTLFVSTDFVGHEGYLDWNQLRALAAEGVEIGNHSASHGYLVEMRNGETPGSWRERIAADIARAQRQFATRLKMTPRLFAYPFGEYSPGLKAVVREAGFLGAVAQQSGVMTPGGDLFSLPRFPMGGPYATVDGFREKLTMRSLPVEVLAPSGPVLMDENPPVMIVQIKEEVVDLERLRCFVAGQEEGEILPVPGKKGRFMVRASHPLEGRRNKYTLTAPGLAGKHWYWFSQLWVKAGEIE